VKPEDVRHAERAERGLVLVPELIGNRARDGAHDDLSIVAEALGDGSQDALLVRAVLVAADDDEGALS
jgi:hypothetical protein